MKKKEKTFKCPECGYKKIELFGKTCPMCCCCPRCQEKLMKCVCMEGE